MEYSNLTDNSILGHQASPAPYQVWGYGLLIVTGINLCSLLGIAVKPMSRQHWYSTLLLFMVSVAVGVLAGSSLLFLLAGALEIDKMEWQYRKQYIYKMTIALATIFVFFNFEQILKLLLAKWSRLRLKKAQTMLQSKLGSSSKSQYQNASQNALQLPNNHLSVMTQKSNRDNVNSDSFVTAPMLTAPCSCSEDQQQFAIDARCDTLKVAKTLSRDNDISLNQLPVSSVSHHHPNTRVSAVAGISIGLAAAGVGNDNINCMNGDNEVFETPDQNCPHFSSPSENNTAVVQMKIEKSTSNGDRKRERNDSVASFAAKSLSDVQPVAWMVIFGDGIHNFVDGLSIGAGMARSFPEGLSIALAVLAEELPHELGDLAVLLKAGLPLKKALGFNFLSACLCYLGFVVGAIVGEIPEANTFIYAVAAGLFLYIALTDLLPEIAPDSMPEGSGNHGHSHHADHHVTEHVLVDGTSAASPIRTLSLGHLCSHLAIADAGMLLGYAVILLLAFYTDDIANAMSSNKESLVSDLLSTTQLPSTSMR